MDRSRWLLRSLHPEHSGQQPRVGSAVILVPGVRLNGSTRQLALDRRLVEADDPLVPDLSDRHPRLTSLLLEVVGGV